MTFSQAISDAFAKFTDFSSRSSRPAYWWFVLFAFIVYMCAFIIDAVLGTYPIVYILAILALFIPSLAVGIRRLHDIGKSGWWVLIGFVPFVGFIVLLVFALQPSQGPNQWGEAPDVPATA